MIYTSVVNSSKKYSQMCFQNHPQVENKNLQKQAKELLVFVDKMYTDTFVISKRTHYLTNIKQLKTSTMMTQNQKSQRIIIQK